MTTKMRGNFHIIAIDLAMCRKIYRFVFSEGAFQLLHSFIWSLPDIHSNCFHHPSAVHVSTFHHPGIVRSLPCVLYYVHMTANIVLRQYDVS